MTERYNGRIQLHVCTHTGDLDLIGDDRSTFIATVGRGLLGDEFERAKSDAHFLINAWNDAHAMEKAR